MKKWLFPAGLITVMMAVAPLAEAALITNATSLPQTSMAKPAAGSTYTDPVFGTKITRLTDAKSLGINGIVPDYSKRQVWNSNQTKMMLRTGDGVVRLYDGSTYTYIKDVENVYGEDVFWSPTDPDIIIFSADNTVNSYRVSTGEITPIQTFPGYTWVNTKAEGNLSRDGKTYGFVGQFYNESTQNTEYKELIVFDLSQKKIISQAALPSTLESFDWASISPSGNYFVVDYASDTEGRYHGVEVYDRNLKFLWQKPLGAGHSDMMIDGDGNDVLVMDYYDASANETYIKKFRLSDGAETTLLTLPQDSDDHISCRNIQKPSWCLISTFDYVGKLSASSSNWLPFENEVFWLNLDGSKGVQRLAHHHSRRFSPSTPDPDQSDYFAEPHATASPNGDRVVFASNWETNIGQTSGDDTYLIDLSGGVAPPPPNSCPTGQYSCACATGSYCLQMGAMCLNPSSPCPGSKTTNSFPDVPSTHVNAEAIAYVKDQGIVSGYPDGTYQPDNEINRAEFTKIIIGATFDMATIDGCIANNVQPQWAYMFFPDVQKDEWFAKYICVAKMEGVVSGYPDGSFKPSQNINFVEAAKIMVNSFKISVGSDSVWYKPFVLALQSRNAVPMEITSLAKLITRGDMAEMTYRLKADVTNKSSKNLL